MESVYNELARQIGRRETKKLANNTYAVRVSPDALGVKLHDTVVVTAFADGRVRLDSGSWQTLTTKDRINSYLPSGWTLYQESGVWYLRHHGPRGFWAGDGEEYAFEDGFTIGPDGAASVDGRTPSELGRFRSEKAKLARQIRRYVKDYMEALGRGEVPAPSGGDCWYCAMCAVAEGGEAQPLGDAFANQDHLISHLEEPYYVPSLLANAVREFPGHTSLVAKGYLAARWGDERFMRAGYESWADVAKRQLGATLAKYLRRRLGLAG